MPAVGPFKGLFDRLLGSFLIHCVVRTYSPRELRILRGLLIIESAFSRHARGQRWTSGILESFGKEIECRDVNLKVSDLFVASLEKLIIPSEMIYQ